MAVTLFGDYREKILSLHQKESSEIPQYIAILREWLGKQPHLPSDLLEDEVLQLYLIKCKFSVEKTKRKIENYCTLKGIHDSYFNFTELCIPSKEPSFYFPIPKLTENYHRVIIGKYWRSKDYDLEREMKNSLLFGDMFLRFDYNDGEIFIIDFSEISIPELIPKFRANVVADAMVFLLQGHVSRIKQVHYITKGSMILSILKPFLPAKIASRVIEHDKCDTLKNYFSLDDLPKDYGGNLKSLKEMLMDVDEFYKTHEMDFKNYAAVKSREELRIGGPLTNEMQGTFRKLNID